MCVPLNLIRQEIHALSQEILRALERVLGESGIAASNTAEWILVDALVGPERRDVGLLPIDVFARLDDAAIERLIPQLEGMRGISLALAGYREQQRAAARRSFIARFRRRG